MTETAWIAVLAVLCVGLMVSMLSVAAFAWQQWAALRSEQVARAAEKTGREKAERERDVLRLVVEHDHGRSPQREAFIARLTEDALRQSALDAERLVLPVEEARKAWGVMP